MDPNSIIDNPLLQTIFDSCNESFLLLNHSWRIIDVSRSFYRTFQIKDQSVKGEPIHSLMKGALDFPALHHSLYKVLNEGTTVDGYIIKHNFEGVGEKTISINASKVQMQPGQPAYVLLVLSDITAESVVRKREEEFESKYNKFVEGLNSLIIAVNREGKITFFNNFCEKIFGYSRHEVIGELFIGKIIPCVDSTGKDNTKLFSSILANPKNYSANESEGRKKDGGKVWFTWNVKAIYDSQNEITEVLIDGNDITELANSRKKLDEKSAMLETVLEFIPEGVMITGADKRVRAASKFASEILGINRDDLLNVDEKERLKLLNLYWPDGSRLTEPDDLPHSKAINTGKVYKGYTLQQRTDGIIKTLTADAAPVVDVNGHIIGAVGSWRDISKESEYLLQIEKRKRVLDSIVNNISVGVMVADSEGNLIEVNKIQCEFLNLSEDKILGRKEQLVTQGILDANTRLPPLAHSLPLSRAIRNKDTVQDQEFVFIRNGKEYVFAVSAAPILDSNGDVEGGVTLWRDISEQKQSSRRFQLEANFFRSIFEEHKAVMLLIDPETSQIIDANNSAVKFYGYNRETIRKMKIGDLNLLNPEQIAYELKLARNNKREYFNFQHRLSNGQIRWVEVYSSTVRTGQGDLLFSIIHDITERRKAEEALKKSEQNYRSIFENVAIGITESDDQERFLAVNEHLCSMLNYSREELRQLGIRQITAPEDLDKSEQVHKQIHDGKTDIVSYEKRYLRKNGTPVWVHVTVSAIRDVNNKLIGTIGTAEDITERRRLAEQLKRERDLLNTIFESIPVMITLYDPAIKRLEVNKAFYDITGYTDSDLKNNDIMTLVYPNAQYRQEVRQFMQSLTPGFKDLRMTIKGGSEIDSSWANVRLPDGGRVGIGIDISKRKEIERKLHQKSAELERSNNFVNAILQTSGALIAVLDLSGRIIRFNKACEILTGYKADEAIQQSNVDFLIPDNERSGIAGVLDKLRSGDDIEHENHWVTRTGEKHFIRWRNTVLINERGKPEFIIATGIDISDRIKIEQKLSQALKQAEDRRDQLNQRSRELADVNMELEFFSYSVSHDLRNPLSIIRGLADILIYDYSYKLDDEGRSYLEKIVASTEKAQKLINDILNLSRIGRQEMKREKIDLSAMVGNYLKELHSIEPQRDVKFIVQPEIHVFADSRMLHVAIENLLRNAWKFTSKKRVAVIQFGIQDLNGLTVYFIKDNGAGFKIQFAQAIFEPFKRVHAEKQFGGTGIGLSIVKRVIKRHNGNIWAEGKVDEGATFYFTLGNSDCQK